MWTSVLKSAKDATFVYNRFAKERCAFEKILSSTLTAEKFPGGMPINCSLEKFYANWA